MDIREIIAQYGVEFLGRYYSPHRGFVLDNIDPNNAERLYIIIPNIHDGLKTWAYPKGISGGPNTGFKYLTPNVGDVVWVEFEKGNPTSAVWSYCGWASDQIPDELLGIDTCGFVTPNGNKVYLNEKEGVLNIKVNQGVELSVKDGTTISIQGKQTLINGGNNRGLVNVEQIESLVKAILQDLLTVSTGTQLSNWMGTELPKLEDTKVKH